MAKWYYAVRVGREVGIFSSWDECKQQVIGYPDARYKKFSSEKEALDFIHGPQNTKVESYEVIAYVDGSYDIASGSYSYGVVIIDGDDEHTFSGREFDLELSKMRNVAGEIKGSMVAMKWALENGKKNIAIHYDYTGIENWALGNWKTNKDGTKEYKRFFDSIKKDLDVHFIKVKAHSGNKYNDLADKLAKEAI